ncbi:FxLD family lanthipeptide [Parafrankia sp. FMc6]|uniref:FxLD family lanthipeptide n=1 Tax=Parafrankia soli TaxID=2599596 RepID=UPI0034D3F261
MSVSARERPILVPTTPQSGGDVFDLDVALLEMTDPAGLVNVTDDNCTSTCGACVTGAV